MDYNTDWDYSIDKYLDEDEQYQEEAVADEGEGDGEGDQQRGQHFINKMVLILDICHPKSLIMVLLISRIIIDVILDQAANRAWTKQIVLLMIINMKISTNNFLQN